MKRSNLLQRIFPAGLALFAVTASFNAQATLSNRCHNLIASEARASLNLTNELSSYNLRSDDRAQIMKEIDTNFINASTSICQRESQSVTVDEVKSLFNANLAQLQNTQQ